MVVHKGTPGSMLAPTRRPSNLKCPANRARGFPTGNEQARRGTASDDLTDQGRQTPADGLANLRFRLSLLSCPLVNKIHVSRRNGGPQQASSAVSRVR